MTDNPLPPTPHSPETLAAVQAARDADHLRLLEIGYYIAGGATILGVSILLFHFTFLLLLGLNPQFFAHQGENSAHHAAPPPPGLFLGLAGLIAFIILLGWTFGALQIYAGRCLKHRTNSLLILIVAGVECVFIPWGTLLGVSTFLVIQRPSVHALFGYR